MPKINQEEYEVLKALDDKWKWIARDKDGTLVMGAGKNERYLDGWFPPVNVGDSLVVDETNAVKDVSEWGNLFQFIQWEDESPYNIQELIEEYLYDNQPKLFIDGQEQSFEFIEESEETEVKKNIEWLKSAIQRNLDFYNDNDEEWQMAKVRAYAKSLDLINQLDEPEVLSQEWISENVEYAYFDMLDGSGRLSSATAIIKPEKLQNLLVPKQEFPVIPKFVAEVIVEHKELGYDVYDSIDLIIETNGGGLPSISDWVARNIDKYARAWLDGYRVEEPKYYAKIKGHENIYSGICFWIYDTEIEELLIDNAEIYPDVTAGYMIKATKDEWANLGINDDNADFVKVEEME